MTDRELMQQAFDAMSYGNSDEREAARLALRDRLAQPEQEPENPTDADRLDWLQKAADARKVELARSIYKTGYEIGEWPSMRVTVKYGSLRQAIDAAMMKAGKT